MNYLAACLAIALTAAEPSNSRRPKDDAELTSWLTNMARHHFTTAEMATATGLGAAEIEAAGKRLPPPPKRKPDDALTVLPYPGGRHPRLGFRDGAVDPQRETKVSVFLPWDDAGYVVADVPEAIWHQHGLLYLAHTHVPTVWTKKGVTLERGEWQRHADGSLTSERRLPNGVVFGTKVVAGRDAVRMEMWLTNRSAEPLRDLRVQNCVMLGHAAGFAAQTNDNKVFRAPYTAAHSADRRRWVITAWAPCHRAWGNPPCPCLHSDPKFPDCPPGETRRLTGWLSFYEGTDVDAEFRRIEGTGWRAAATRPGP
jgi:hypothetical protein